jgi:hypothetical protein
MPHELHWSNLRTGIISALVIALLIAATLMFARVGVMHGKKVTLYVLTNDATGVLRGTEVWLAGRKSGLVTNVAFRPASTSTAERLLITTEFLVEALPNVRRDSWAQVRAGGSLMGAPVVYVSAGSATSPALHDGDTLHVREKKGIAAVATEIGNVGPDMSALVSDLKELNTTATRPIGTIGLFRSRGMPAMPEFSARLSRLTGKATNGNGTIALAMRHDLMGRASRVMARTDSIRTLMASGKGSVGRFRRDTTLMTKISGVMAELDTLRALASDPLGSIGGAHGDSALVRQLNRRKALMDSLKADVKKRPLSYINF